MPVLRNRHTANATLVSSETSHLPVGRALLVALLVFTGVLSPASGNAEAAGPIVIEARVESGSDDAEERSTGDVNLTSSDLELVRDESKGDQVIGIRFTGVEVPQGAHIDNVYVQFQVDEKSSELTTLTLRAEEIDNASPFIGGSFDITSRMLTAIPVAWSPPAWNTVGEAGIAQRTPDLTALVQDVVDRPGWTSGNAIAFAVSGSGKRVAESHDGKPSAAPLLHVEYSQAVSVDAVDDTAAEGAPSDDGVFRFTRSGPTDQAMTVDYVVTGTATPNSDYSALPGAVVIAAGEQLADVVVTPLDDAEVEGSETVVITVVNGPDYVAGSSSTATVTVLDSETPTVSVAASDAVAIEGADPPNTAEFTFSRSGPVDQELSVDYTLTGDATPGVDYAALSGSVTIDAGATTATVVVDPLDDLPSEGVESVLVTVVDGGNYAAGGPSVATAKVADNDPILDVRVAVSADDAEEAKSGDMDLTSSDLEFVSDPANDSEVVGLRFAISAPRAATVTAAWVQFQVDSISVDPTTLTIEGEAVDEAAPFSNTPYDISSRPRTGASVIWSPEPWDVKRVAGPDQRTPDLSAVIQEIVDRPGWVSSASLALVITGTGLRSADSFDGDPSAAPVLHVEYAGTGTPANQAPLVEAKADSVVYPTAAVLDGSVSDDLLPDPPGSVTTTWSQVSGPGTVTFADESAIDTTSTFSEPGVYELRLTAHDGELTTGDSVLISSVDSNQPTDANVRFAAFGDYGVGCCGEVAVSSLVETENPDFIITTGDNRYVNDMDLAVGQFYASYIGNYQGEYGLGSPINRSFPAIGNHDYSEFGGVDVYLNYFSLPGGAIATSATSGNERYYDFIQGPVHFFVINSNSEEPDGQSSTSVQAQWLQTQLATSTSQWQIVYMHHAPFSSSSGPGPTTNMQWPFEAWGADAVLAGHDHDYERLEKGGIPYFVVGSGGDDLHEQSTNPDPDSQFFYNADFGALMVDACDTRLAFEFHSVSEGVVDSYSVGAETCSTVNNPPVASDDSATTTEDAAVVVDVVVNDTDPDGNLDPTTTNNLCVSCTDPVDGSLTNHGDGTFTYTPNSDYNGTDSFVYEVCDLKGQCDTATVSLTISAVEDSPVAVDDSASTGEDVTVIIDVAGNDADPDGNLIVSSAVPTTTPTSGSASGNGDGTVTYDPDPGFNGVDTFEYEICDTTPLCATATVRVLVGSGGTVSYVSLSSSGSVPGITQTVRDEDIVAYDPAASSWSMFFEASDVGITTSDLDAFHVRGNGSVLISFSSDGMAIPGLAGGPDGELIDDSDVILFTPTSIGDTTAGSFLFYFDGSDVDLTSSGEDVDGLFEFADGSLGISTTGSVTVGGLASGGDEDVHRFTGTFGAVTSGAWELYFDGSDVGLTTSAEDLDGVSFDNETDLMFSTTGTYDAAGGAGDDEDISRFTGTFGAATSGSAALEFDASAAGIDPSNDVDALHLGSSFTPGPTGGPPVAVDDTDTTTEDTAATIDVAGNDSDPDGNLDPTSATPTAQPTSGVATGNGDGTISYTPDQDFYGPDSFDYQVCDLTGLCDTATVTVTVTAVDDDPPVAADDSASTPSGTGVTVNVVANDTDPDDNLDPNSATPVTQPTSGTASGNGDGTITYTPNPGFVGGDSFDYEVCDLTGLCDTATVSISVTGTAPVAADDTGSTTEDVAVVIDVVVNDSDADGDLDPASAAPTTQPTSGTASGNGDGTISYTPGLDFNGPDSFDYQVCDVTGLCDTATVSLDVSSVDDPPVAVVDSVSTASDTAVTIDVAANDTDVDGDLDPDSAAPSTQPTSGIATGNSNGTITYEPDPGFSGVDTFVYEICDLTGLCSTATVTVTVTVGQGGVQRSFRIRDDSSSLGTDGGWLAATNTDVFAEAEQALRVRFEIDALGDFSATYGLQYSRDSGAWTDVPVQSTPVASGITPSSVESTPSDQFSDGTATNDLLSVATGVFVAGEADAASNATGTISLSAGEHTELEFAVRIRKFYDDAGLPAENVDGSTFDFRVVESDGTPLTTEVTPRITVDSSGLLGGTYAESPGDLLVKDTSGNLYFPVEDWEATARIMMMKSSDGGVTWQALDIANRPSGIDMESATVVFDSSSGVIHLIHDGGGNVVRHQFRTSDHATNPDTWGVTDETVQTYTKPTQNADQWVSAVLRNNGDIVVAYNGPADASAEHKAFVIVNSGGSWGVPFQIDDTTGEDSYFPWLELGADDETHIVYMTSAAGVNADTDDAALTYKRLSSADVLDSNVSRKNLATGLDTGLTRRAPHTGVEYFDDAGASVLVAAYLDRFVDQKIHTIRIDDFGTPNGTKVATDNTVSAGGGASRMAEGHMQLRPGTKELHLLYVDEATHDVWHTTESDDSGWSTPDTELQDDVDGAWVRGLIFEHSASNGSSTVFGYVYDDGTGAASGGQGPIYYAELELPAIVPGDPPVAVDDTGSTTEDTAVIINVVSNDTDPDGDLDPTTATPTTQPTSGTATGNSDGTITYIPAQDFNGPDSFDYQVCDLTGRCDTATVSAVVSPADDPPVAADDNASTAENTAVNVDVAANDTDVDGDLDPTTAAPTTQPVSGVATENGDGTITYTPDTDFNGVDTFAYEICDLAGLCSTATVTVTVGAGGPVYHVSFTSSTTVPGIVGTVKDEDAVIYDPTTGLWSMFFDASDVGITSSDLDAIHVRSDGTILLSYSSDNFDVPGMTGGPNGTSVDDSDVVLFTPTSIGDTTAGSFSFYFDGSDVDLTTNGEDIDGLYEFADGSLGISTTGSITVTGLPKGGDEDIHRFTGTFGADTSGTWELYFDGTDVGFTSPNDDLNAVSFDNDDLIFSTKGLASNGIGDDEDLQRFTGTFGNTTTGSTTLELDLSTLGIDPTEDVDALHHG